MITLHEFAKIVMSMRVSQGRYFNNPTRENLICAKEWETKGNYHFDSLVC